MLRTMHACSGLQTHMLRTGKKDWYVCINRECRSLRLFQARCLLLSYHCLSLNYQEQRPQGNEHLTDYEKMSPHVRTKHASHNFNDSHNHIHFTTNHIHEKQIPRNNLFILSIL